MLFRTIAYSSDTQLSRHNPFCILQQTLSKRLSFQQPWKVGEVTGLILDPVGSCRKMAIINQFLHRLLIVLLSVILTSADTSDSHVNFVVVGATGSLAQKYLWQGMYDLREQIAEKKVTSRSVPDLVLYGGARAEPSKGEKALLDILDKNVSYENDDEEVKRHFMASVRFFQLKTCEHYEALCRAVLDVPDGRGGGQCHADGSCDSSSADTPRILATDNGHSKEAGRIFYLAVPPYSYAEVAKCIHRVCRSSRPEAFLRLVLEKPFGTNVDTVQSLVTALQEDFQDEDIYLVDHYLGKPAVQQILEFRHLNRDWLEPLLNGHHVEKVEIAIKEKEDVDGRLNYFDTYGVFLDVVQNHAVEMLCLTAMDLVADQQQATEAIRREKLRFLRTIQPIHPDHVVAGQYKGYVAEGRHEFGRDDFDSRTPTFGAVVLQVSNWRWRGVPFFLVSGKALNAKASVVRITFKDTTFPIAEGRGSTTAKREISILVSSSASSRPRLSASRSIADGRPIVSTWSELEPSSSESLDTKMFEFVGLDRAYSSVVADVFFGRRENFVGMEQLTASWAIWDSYLRVAKTIQPKPYRKGFPEDLNVVWTSSGLRFVDTPTDDISDDIQNEKLSPNFKMCNTDQVSSVVKPTSYLIKDIVRELTEVVRSTDDEFHLAIPGGRTPLPIFHELLSSRTFPWNRVHFWFTDERCVRPTHRHSNFLNAEESLFKHLQLPILNVHRMPVDLKSGLCNPDDHGASLYTEQLEHYLGANRSLDVVLLGVGSDGHVASLFPADDVGSSDEAVCSDSNDDDRWVKLTKAGRGHVVEQRMSVTFKTIANAKSVFLVITGREKHGVVKELLNDNGRIPATRFPVKNVAAIKSLRIFVDNEAYFG